MSLETQYCLKWNNYGTSITSTLNKLYQLEDFVDVTIVAGDAQLRAHKVVLSACSSFFRSILKNNPCQHPIIILKEVTAEDLKSIVAFIYEGEVNVTQQRLHTFMKLAEVLQVRGLTESSSILNSAQQNEEKSQKSLDLTTSKKKAAISPVTSEMNAPCSSNDDSYHNCPSPIYTSNSGNKRRRISSELIIPSPKSVESSFSNDDPKSNLQEMLEVKMEQLEEDSEEGKENGAVDCRMRKAKTKKLPQKEEPSHAPPILTVPQRGSPANKQFLSKSATERSSNNFQPEFPLDPACQSLPYPCPFCEKSYTSWGFRRRHIKAFHSTNPELSCKWCYMVLPCHVAWEEHVTSCHRLSLNDARNGILILEEAHMVLQIAQPTRVESLMELIKQKKDQKKETKTPSPKESVKK